MHRNTYIHSPRLLCPTLQLRAHPNVFVAGQITGTEGYLESSATGLVAGRNAARLVKGCAPVELPQDTMLGALLAAISDPAREHFQPMNVNMGLLPPVGLSVSPDGKKRKLDKQTRNAMMAARALERLDQWMPAGGL
jgi:methylenetetrahydrofolate--tRNA-(uracil-5-)-methyltransferase